MAAKDTGGRLKSAWELALERLDSQGISRPDEGNLSDATRQEMAELRRRTEAKLAELEILHRDRLAKSPDPIARAELDEEYHRERRRLEEERDRKIERLRGGRGDVP